MANIENHPKLRELCELASQEHDHEKLMDLLKQINELLEKEKEEEENRRCEKAPPANRTLRQESETEAIRFEEIRAMCVLNGY